MQLKIILLIFLQFSFVINEKSKNFIEGFRFRAVECQTFDNTTAIFDVCMVKAISRKLTTLNVMVKVLKKIDKPFFASFILSYRYGNIYREVIKNEFEWCSTMENSAINPIVKHFIELSDTIKTIFRKCPIIGDFGALNVTAPNELPVDKLFPSGYYQDVWKFLKNGKLMFEVKYFFESKSQIKTSFG